ncbi:MAG: caspase family protein [Acidobacteriaceae bacterium]|nr:caspase family protein [Acidobacteriaceae bacterium]
MSSEKPEIVVQTGNTFPVQHIALSRDGRLLASTAFTEHSIELWDVQSGRQLRTFLMEGGSGAFGMFGVSEVALSGGGQFIAAASQKEVDVWNVKDGQRIYRFPTAGSSGDGTSLLSLSQPLALSAGGRYIAWAVGGKVDVRDLSNRGQPVTLPADAVATGSQVLAVAFAPAETELAILAYSGSGTIVSTVELAGGPARSRTLPGHHTVSLSQGIAYSSDGHIVVAIPGSSSRGRSDAQGNVSVLDLTSNAAFDFQAPNQNVAISQDAAFVAVQDQNELQVWDIQRRQKTFSSSNRQRGFFNTSQSAVDFTGDGKWIAIGDSAGGIHIFDVHTGAEQATLVGHSNVTGAVSFDEKNARLYSGGKTAWDLKSGIGLRTVPGSIGPRSIPASNGSFFAENAGHGVVRLWDLSSQKVIATLNAPPEQLISGTSLTPMVFSPDGSAFALIRQEDFSTPEAQARQRERSLRSSKELARTLKKDPQQMSTPASMLALGPDNPALQIKVFDTRTGAERFTLKGHSWYISALAFSKDGATIASAADDVKLWSAADGKLLGSIPLGQTSQTSPLFGGATTGYTNVTSLAFSPDGKSIGAALYSYKINADFSSIQQQAIAAAQQSAAASSRRGHRTFGGFGGIGLPGVGRKTTSPPPATTAAPNPSEMMHLSTEGPVLLLDPSAGRPVATLPGHPDGSVSLAFSHDGNILATSGRDGFLRIWESASGSLSKEIATGAMAFGVAFSPDDKLLASALSDGSTSLWEVQSGKLLATLVSLYDGDDWLVVTPDGLFDGSPAAWNQILWRYSRNTFDVAPVESFFNEYFYPGLLADIVSGKRPRPARAIAEKDRRQPEVKINFDRAGSAVADRELVLKINVSEAPAGAGRADGSGAKDVRLFRNGSLVKAWHGDVLGGNTSAALEAKVRVVAGANRFTAYAFNRDNVKSRDAQLMLRGSDALRAQPVTYVLTVGINNFENPNYALRLAVADAQSLAHAIQREQSRISGKVEVISLYDDAATRSGILDAIRAIASKAQPEDHVVLFFASHGTAAHDHFYLIPHDLGFTGHIDELDEAAVQQILSHSVSDQDLEQALENMDAGNIVVIIDACNSGQALESEEKRRGPMNSRGLAQLAYEKGMYILTASQSYQAALEVSQLGHGLLTYALISEGLDKGLADDEPHDGKILDREWLGYATKRVPEIQIEALRSFKAQGRALSFESAPEHSTEGVPSQRPKIFYRRELGSSPWVIAQPPESPSQPVASAAPRH